MVILPELTHWVVHQLKLAFQDTTFPYHFLSNYKSLLEHGPRSENEKHLMERSTILIII